MFKFFDSNGPLPYEYQIAHICATLQLNYFELLEQPDFWVEDMIVYYAQRNKAEEFRQKKNAAKNKTSRRLAKR